MVQLYTSPWRSAFADLLRSVRRDLLIAVPFIKTSEAVWVCEILLERRPLDPIRIQVLTDVRSDSVASGSLEIDALRTLAEGLPSTRVVNLPRLHAKVYVADENLAVVGSANLTSAGLDSNYEYGIGITEPSIVARIRGDLEAYARVGNVLDTRVLADLAAAGRELSAEYQELQRSATTDLRRSFNEKLRIASLEFLKAQVGTRSANSLFSEAIVYVLSKGPLPTRDLQPRIQELLPDLCDDSVELVINGQHFGKRWKHGVRNAQQFLKATGVVAFDGTYWSLTHGT
jgi:phosphatidylserine/phosphatidylglycerophosphate/cardiolipin synthase-like enzyme